jgi:hypothetical protein
MGRTRELTVALTLRRWRTVLAFGALGVAIAAAYHDDWPLAVAALAAILLIAAGRVRSEIAATREMLRGPGRPEPRKPSLLPVPRPRRPSQPPWPIAPMPAIGHAASCPAMASMMPDGLCRCGVRAS